MKHPVRYRLEYALLLFFGFLCRIPPRIVALAFAWPWAKLLYFALVKKRREACRRIRFVVGPDVPEREIRRIAWISFRNLIFTAVEMFRVPHMSEKELSKIAPNGFAAVEKVKEEMTAAGTGAVISLPHCGNWALAGAFAKCRGIDIFSVEGKQSNPYVNALIHRLQTGGGISAVQRGSAGGRAFIEMLRGIKRGGAFAILPDVRSRQPGIEVGYFGGRANVHRGMGLMAYKTGAPIVPLVVRRRGWMKFDVEVFPTIHPNLSEPVEKEEIRLAEETAKCMDAAIRAEPEQWFWYNSRWLLDPLESKQNTEIQK